MKITTYLFIGFLSTLRDEGKSDFSIHTYAKKRKCLIKHTVLNNNMQKYIFFQLFPNDTSFYKFEVYKWSEDEEGDWSNLNHVDFV